ncbi:hypothetical protein MnTg02_01282 [bacterium MnTg02]|nr:hypothetical protein MnTg02_01282 [bacterium MnTg02]
MDKLTIADRNLAGTVLSRKHMVNNKAHITGIRTGPLIDIGSVQLLGGDER